jgi:hypothetical protein
MIGEAERAGWALQLFDGFVAGWTPPAASPHLQAEADVIRRAIAAIAPPPLTRVVGYAVFAMKSDRDRECGFEYIAISAVFDEPPTNIMAGNVERVKKLLSVPPQQRERQMLGGSVVRLDELREYVICAVQQI